MGGVGDITQGKELLLQATSLLHNGAISVVIIVQFKTTYSTLFQGKVIKNVRYQTKPQPLYV